MSKHEPPIDLIRRVVEFYLDTERGRYERGPIYPDLLKLKAWLDVGDDPDCNWQQLGDVVARVVRKINPEGDA